MNYDLYFLADGAPPSRDAFLAYFRARPRYEIEGDAVRRSDAEIGATWSFRLTSPATTAEPGKTGPPTDAWASFRLESEARELPESVIAEVAAFARDFGSQVFDPQTGSRGKVPGASGKAASDADAAARYPPEGTPRSPQKKRLWFGFYGGNSRRSPGPARR